MQRILGATCGALSILLAAGADAQAPTVHTGATEVLVDMVVRDKKSKIVRDLKPEEILILEDGVPQTIRHFELVDHHEPENAEPSTVPSSLVAVTPAAPTAPAERSSVRTLRESTVVSIVVGSLNPEGRKSARDAVQEFIKKELRPNTFVGVFVMGYNGVNQVQAYTNDGALIGAAMEQVVRWTSLRRIDDPDILPDTLESADTAPPPAAGPAADIAAMMSTHWMNEYLDSYDRSARELVGLHHFVQAQAKLPGRKLLFLFAGGLGVHADTIQVLNSAISVANRSNVTVYSIDTIRDIGQNLAAGRRLLAAAANSSRTTQMTAGRGLVTGDQVAMFDNAESSIRADERGNMRVLAESTGGALLPVQDLREPFRRAMEEARTHYELTYSPARSEVDGRFRKIEVKVARPGVKVFARNGYYALPMLRGEEIYPFELAALQALNTTPAPQQLEFHSNVLKFRPGSQRSQLMFACEIPVRGLSVAEDKEWATVHVSIAALVKDAQGQVVDKLSKDLPYAVPHAKAAELRRGVVSFTTPFRLPPGRFWLEIAVLDRDTGHAGVRRSVLVVPPAPNGLAASDLIVVRRLDPAEEPHNSTDPLFVRGGKMTPELFPVDRDVPGDVSFYAAAYLPMSAQDSVRVVFELFHDGKRIVRSAETEVPVEANSVAPFLASFPRAKLQPGQYEAIVTFRYRDQSVRSETAFAVEAGQSSAKQPQ